VEDYLDRFQLIALMVFLTVFVGRSLHMVFVKKINPFALGVGKQGLRRVVEVGFLFGFVAWALEIIASAMSAGWRIFPEPMRWQIVNSMPFKIVGAILITSGIAIFVLALISFGTSWRVGIDEKTPGGLVTTGMFSLSRNPIFVCLDLYAFGVFLMNGALGFIIFALLLAAGVHYQILQEERFLLKTYGMAYQRYCDRTARYLGRRSSNQMGRMGSAEARV
jgi:protein-S-isoprenylcysteine O-methyltransferase Ste14